MDVSFVAFKTNVENASIREISAFSSFKTTEL
jgi:hypothetical protein